MIYFDHNATTHPFPSVLEAVMRLYGERFLNPSSVHSAGKKAKHIFEGAKREILELLGAKCHEIYFTSGATEANNMALFSQDFKMIFTAESEHPSVREPALARPHKMLKLGAEGLVDLEDLRRSLAEFGGSDFLVSLCYANGETGVVQKMAEISAIVREFGGVLHTDAAQFVGKESLDLRKLDVDILTFSGHKIHAIHGIGAAVFKSGLPVRPLILGGGQQGFKRAGTLNLAGIVALCEALRTVSSHEYIAEYKAKTSALTSRIADFVLQNGGMVACAGAPKITNTLMLGQPHNNAFVQMIEFDLSGIMVSSGSACSSGKTEVAAALRAISQPLAQNFIRVSVDASNTHEEVEKFLEVWLRLQKR